MRSARTAAAAVCAALAGSLTLTGCMVGPDYHAPADPELSVTPPAKQDGADGPKEVSAKTLAAWWTVLDDAVLTDLIHEALAENRDFQAARAAVRQARAQLGIAVAGLLPQLNASGLYQKSRTSKNMDMGPSVKSGLYQGQFDATWEIDIFGGTRRRVEAADADLRAQEANVADSWVTLAGEVAETYIALRTNQRLLVVTTDNLKTQQHTLELLQSRRKAGLADELAVLQARYNTQRTRALLPTLREGVERARNALAVLTGRVPTRADDRLRTDAKVPLPPKDVAVGIPANALRRRPDIRRAERALAAQTARIGEATADLFPKFYLLGSIGLDSVDSGRFLRDGSRAWSWGPTVSWPIFRGGSIRQNIKVQTALQEQLLARYEQTVLLAVKEVHDALVGYAEQRNRRASLVKAVQAAKQAVDVSQDRYNNGLVDFSNVLDAQRSLLVLDEQLILTEGEIATSLVRLYKALGGGWEALADGKGDKNKPDKAEKAAEKKP